MPASAPLRIVFIDMNAGVQNQAMRCLASVVSHFEAAARRDNPGLRIEERRVSPRDTGEAPPRDGDLYIATGGPGSPWEGPGTRWYDDFRRFVDVVLDEQERGLAVAKSLFPICYSYELLTMHLELARVEERDDRKFGVMPVYTTTAGRVHPLLAPFGDRLFAFEHRHWEVVDFDEAKLARLHGQVLATESREGRSDKGSAVLGFHIGRAIETVQFHPEADLSGIFHWLDQPEHSQAFRDAYGEETYQRMLRTLHNPRRVQRVHAELIPGWMRRRFNAMAEERGYNRIEEDPPIESSVLASPIPLA
ncbi:MAG: hypothetical protein KF718_20400 [Polyangiaceae bacterium]|nr:hypothetical protein [Polyangiaceae bacterium]